ncbi:amidase family protein [Actinidia rufa]|uniref:Amidase family protein n=1 Tax=Actinidia rufa TaxID=165716 RepID=A0A7J0D9T6_9ERIC|nr:amidase family protein [Actinidia rufa]
MHSQSKKPLFVTFQTAFRTNQLNSRKLVEFYIEEIRRLNPVVRGVIEVNPDALYQADLADKERKAKAPRSLYGLHGIPVLLKDNIATKDRLNTTAGSFALLKSIVPRDAGCSGSAISVAANMVAVSVGTETDGSILCPSSSNAVVGIKPTVGLTSRAGVIPISPRQDTIGPICRTVADAVHVLDAIVGFDYNDAEATREAAKYIPRGGYTQFLKVDALKGKRIGIEMIKEFGQVIFLAAEATNGIGDTEKAALLNLAKLTGDGFETIMRYKQLDAVVTPGSDAAPVLAIGGFPGISVPAGFDENGVPFGITFGGLKGSEPKLIEIAYGFEQATQIRKPPSFKP